MNELIKPLLIKFTNFARDRLKFERPPRLFLKQDSENAKYTLGRTAHYDPSRRAITIYTIGRHPKDIIRSFAHELVHHCQNERGDLAPEKMKTVNKNYAQECPHMRKMEQEAYLQGNMCFRDWEDGLDDKLQYKMKLAEHKFLKENKTMSVKITKKELKNLIQKLLENKLKEQNIPPASLAGGEESPESVMDKSTYLKQGQKKKRELKGMALKFYNYLLSQGRKEKAAAWAHNYKSGDRMAEIPKEFLAKYKQSNVADAPASKLEEEQLEEGGCGGHSPGKRGCGDPNCPTCKKAMQEAEELEEKKAKPDYIDIDGDGNKKESMKKAAADLKKKKKRKKKANESKIQTPEQENSLYESRFTQRNTRLFEKLLKEWTK